MKKIQERTHGNHALTLLYISGAHQELYSLLKSQDAAGNLGYLKMACAPYSDTEDYIWIQPKGMPQPIVMGDSIVHPYGLPDVHYVWALTLDELYEKLVPIFAAWKLMAGDKNAKQPSPLAKS